MWLPAEVVEVDSLELNVARSLILYSAQCVGLQLVKTDDANTVARFDGVTKTPTVLLVADGKVIDHVDATGGRLMLSNVENMIHHELFQRETALDELLETAKKQSSTDKDAAVAAYQKVWEQRCLAPKQGREAQKALKRLGVTVKVSEMRSTDPVLTPAMNTRLTPAMR